MQENRISGDVTLGTSQTSRYRTKKIATNSLKVSEISKHLAVTLVWSGGAVPWSQCQTFPLLRHFPKEMRHTQGVGTHRPWDTSVL